VFVGDLDGPVGLLGGAPGEGPVLAVDGVAEVVGEQEQATRTNRSQFFDQ